ncbi:MAG: M48 family metallopeptidase [Candidatus Omnitrophota bacterium]|nr:M48 family metallopeptidase [Candidatus Omnitrophota bacterium]
MSDEGYTADKATAYQKIKQKLSLFHLVLTPVLLYLALAGPLASALRSGGSLLGENPFAAVGLYFLLFSVYLFLFDFPLSFYSGFVLEHRFGLSNQSLGAWLGFLGKRLLISTLFSLALVEALYALIRHFPDTWWLFAWAGYAFVGYVLGKIFPVVIVPLFYKYSAVADDALRERILTLAKRYGLGVENVYSLNLSKTTKKANAAFMGLGKTKRVVLSDTLIDNFTHDEIETVVAHELGHFKHRDIWRQLAFGLVTSLIGFWIAFRVMGAAATSWGLEGVSDVGSMPLLFLVFYVFGLALMPVGNGFSRYMERGADRFALEALRRADVFISCMDKLGKVNLADPEPNPVYEWFFYDHPAIGRRIAMAKSFKA